jgi:hypothetical protein
MAMPFKPRLALPFSHTNRALHPLSRNHYRICTTVAALESCYA